MDTNDAFEAICGALREHPERTLSRRDFRGHSGASAGVRCEWRIRPRHIPIGSLTALVHSPFIGIR